MGEKDMTEIRHVDEVLKLPTVISGDNRYYEVAQSEKRNVKNMCEAAERLVNKGIEEGIEKGLPLRTGGRPFCPAGYSAGIYYRYVVYPICRYI